MIKAGSFQGTSVSRLNVQDIRFTRNKENNIIYAIVLGLPTAPVVVKALGAGAPANPGKIAQVQLVGSDHRLHWKQTAQGLHVQLPPDYRPATDFAVSFRVVLS